MGDDASGPQRYVFCDGDVTQESVDFWRRQLLAHHADDPQAAVTLVINSAGGSMAHALGLYTTIRDILGLRVNTICSYVAGSAAVLLFMLGQERLMAPNGYIMLHEAVIRLDGDPLEARDIELLARQTAAMNHKYAAIMAEVSRTTLRRRKTDIQRFAGLMRQKALLHAQDTLKLGLATALVKPARRRRYRKPSR